MVKTTPGGAASTYVRKMTSAEQQATNRNQQETYKLSLGCVCVLHKADVVTHNVAPPPPPSSSQGLEMKTACFLVGCQYNIY